MKVLQNVCKKVAEIVILPMTICFLAGDLWELVGWGLLLIFVQSIVMCFITEKVEKGEEVNGEEEDNPSEELRIDENKHLYGAEIEQLIKKYDDGM